MTEADAKSATIPLPIIMTDVLVDADLTAGMRMLYQRCQLYDMYIVVAGQRFPAHRIALASLSTKFRDRVAEMMVHHAEARKNETEAPANAVADASGGKAPEAERPTLAPPRPGACRYPELHLEGIKCPEVANVLLEFAYSFMKDYEVSSEEANADVLRLAAQLDIPVLEHLASKRLVEQLDTRNVLKRLAICEEVGLAMLSERIIDQVVADSKALLAVSTGQDVMQYPKILQKLLIRAAAQFRPTTAVVTPVKRDAVHEPAPPAEGGKRRRGAGVAFVQVTAGA